MMPIAWNTMSLALLVTLLLPLPTRAQSFLIQRATVKECLARIRNGDFSASRDIVRLTPASKEDVDLLFDAFDILQRKPGPLESVTITLAKTRDPQLLKVIGKYTKAGNWNVSEHLLINESALPALVPFNTKTQKRWAATKALARSGNIDAVPFLEDRLDDRVPMIAKDAAEGLAQIQKEKAVLVLIRRLHGRNGNAVVGAALQQIGAPALEALLKASGSLDDIDARTHPELALIGGFHDQASKGILLQLAKHRSSDIRMRAMQALGTLQATPDIVRALISACRDSDWLARKTAVASLGKLKVKEAVPILVATLNDPDPYVRSEAVNTLGEIGDQQALASIIELFRNRRGKMPTKCFTQAAAKFDGQPAVVFLAEMNRARTKDKHDITSGDIAIALGEMREPTAVPLLVEILQNIGPDPMDGVSTLYAIEALAKHRDQRATRALLEILQKDRRAHVQTAAVKALGELRDKSATEPLLKALERSKQEHKWYDTDIIMALGKIGDSRAVPLLQKALAEDNTWSVYAATALGQIGDEQAISAILNTVEKNDRAGYAHYNAPAISALKEHPSKQGCAVLKKIMEAPSAAPLLRLEAAIGSANCGDKTAGNLAREALADRTGYFTARELISALEVLRATEDAADRSVIESYLESSNLSDSDEVSKAAKKALQVLPRIDN